MCNHNLWSGIKTLDALRNKAAAFGTGCIMVSIEELNAVKDELSHKQKFEQTYCSQCGQEFGPGYHGYSHCESHQRKSKLDRYRQALIYARKQLEASGLCFDHPTLTTIDEVLDEKTEAI